MRYRYPRKQSQGAGKPRTSEEVALAAKVEPMQPKAPEVPSREVLPSMEELVARLKAEGYAPIHWVVHPKGIRADFTKHGRKEGVPSQYTRARVCMQHGNLVKVRQETFPGSVDRGILILDAFPCPFCTPDPIQAILRSPVTR